MKDWGARVDEHWETVNQIFEKDRVMAVALYGSQNYGCETEYSDVDTKAIVLPSLDDVIFERKVNKVIEGDKEGGLCDVKDVRLMMRNFYKASINFLEILATGYYVVNPNFVEEWAELRAICDIIALTFKENLVNSTAGLARHKLLCMARKTEKNAAQIEKYGYDPKEFASLLRVFYFMNRFCDSESFCESLKVTDRQRKLILEARAGNFLANRATDIANGVIEMIEDKRDLALILGEKNESAQCNVEDHLDTLTKEILKKSWRLCGDI